MKYSQRTQLTQLNSQLFHFDAEEISGVLYFTIDLGTKGKQRWKTDGKNTVFVADILS
ncbi:hypothetical protein [Myxosarcina sp. GI1(2024)]